MSDVKLLLGNCLEIAKTLESESVNCIVTSPPYFGLRDYSTEPQIWESPDCDLCEDGNHDWSDFIRPSENKRNNDNSLQIKSAYYKDKTQSLCSKCGAWRGDLGLEPTPSLYVSHLVRLFRELRRVLRDDGVMWLNLGDSYNSSATGHNSVESLLASSTAKVGNLHESNLSASKSRKVITENGLKPKDLMGIPWRTAFALQEDGWYLRSDIIWSKPNPMPESVTDRPTRSHEYIFLLSKSAKYYYDAAAIKEQAIQNRWGGKSPINAENSKGDYRGLNRERDMMPETRNRRSVWTVTTRPFKGAHFATFPPELIKPCILAGCPEGGWVLDPFMGSGTTGEVSVKLNRNFVGMELNPDYLNNIAKPRIDNARADRGEIDRPLKHGLTQVAAF